MRVNGIAWILAACLLEIVACKNTASHIYGARKYEATRDCVDTTTAVDVVNGVESDQPCGTVCLVAPADQDGGRAMYVSRECPPFPPLFDTTGSVPGCDRAMSAYARNDTCLGDGGTTNAADAGAPNDAADAGATGDASDAAAE